MSNPLDVIDFYLLPNFYELPPLHPWLDQLLKILGDIKLQLLFLFGLFIKNRQATRIKEHLFNLSFLFVFIYLLKIFVCRIRPEFHDWVSLPVPFFERLTWSAVHSFPSSHAALAGYWIAYYPNRPIFLTAGLVVCLSRLVGLYHFPTDLLIGFGIGYQTAKWAIALQTKKKRVDKSCLPLN